MDVVTTVTDGWIAARLRIYWDTVSQASANAELNPSDGISYGSSSLAAGATPAADRVFWISGKKEQGSASAAERPF
jgi:hypothetical protein